MSIASMTLTLTSLAAGMSLCAACGDSSGTGSIPAAVADGTYTIVGPICAATGAAPTPPVAQTAIFLRAFDGLATHEVILAGGDFSETIADADCTLVASQKVFSNEKSSLTLTQEFAAAFAPAACTLAVTTLSGPESIGADHAGGATFAARTDKSQSATLTVAPITGGYQIGTPPVSDFGCGAQAVITWNWVKK